MVMSGVSSRAPKKNSREHRRINAAVSPVRASKSRHPIQNVRKSVPKAARAEGSRAAVLLNPKALNERAVAQYTMGGFWKCSTPLRVGTSQSPETAISRPISA
jgi:hypothetical protein